MRAYYRHHTIEGHRQPGRLWYTVSGYALTFETTAAAVAWLDAILANPGCGTRTDTVATRPRNHARGSVSASCSRSRRPAGRGGVLRR